MILFNQNSRNYGATTLNLPAAQIPDNANEIRVYLTRESWPVGPVLEWVMEQFAGGGWVIVNGGTTNGGDYFGDGQLITETRINAPLLPGTARQVRGTVTILQPLRTSPTVEAI